MNKHHGLHLVMLYICVGDFKFPWSFRIWKGKGSKSVTQLALDLVRTVPKTLTQNRDVWVLADGGFDAADFIRGVHLHGFVCIVGTRKNRKTCVDKAVVTKTKPISSYAQRTRVIYLPAVTENGQAIPMYFSWVWLERNGGWEKRYVLSTLDLSPRNLALAGKRRWKIEGFFKTVKHRFGLHRFAQGTKQGVLRYILLSLFAYLISHLRGLRLNLARAAKDLPEWGKLAEDVALELMPNLILELHDQERQRLEQRIKALQL